MNRQILLALSVRDSLLSQPVRFMSLISVEILMTLYLIPRENEVMNSFLRVLANEVLLRDISLTVCRPPASMPAPSELRRERRVRALMLAIRSLRKSEIAGGVLFEGCLSDSKYGLPTWKPQLDG